MQVRVKGSGCRSRLEGMDFRLERRHKTTLMESDLGKGAVKGISAGQERGGM